jgi:hypothetical protein
VERDHGAAEARRLMVEGLRIVGIDEGELGGLKKGDARKLAVALLIRRRTAVPSRWIAEALHLGHVSRLTHAARSSEQRTWASKLESNLP